MELKSLASSEDGKGPNSAEIIAHEREIGLFKVGSKDFAPAAAVG